MERHPRPAWILTADGQDVTQKISERLISLTLTDNRGFGEADQLDVVLDDADGLLSLPSRGAVLGLLLGWDDEGLVDKGTFTVDEVSHDGAPDKLTIVARSADLRSGLTTQMERSFDRTTVGAIVQTVADENGLTAVVEPGLADQAVDHLDQTNESSANLLTRLAKLFDAIVAVKQDRLLFVPAGRGASVSGDLFTPVLITRAEGDSHQFSIADRNAYEKVRATYYDQAAAEKGEVLWGKDEEAAANKQQIPAAAPAAALTAKYLKIGTKPAKSRAVALRAAHKEWKRRANEKQFRAAYAGVEVAYDDRALGASGTVTYGLADEQKERNKAAIVAAHDADAAQARNAGNSPSVAIDASASNVKTLRHVYSNKENARRAARSEWRKIQRGVASFSITLARGRAEIIPETPVTVVGWKPQIDSTDWIAARVTHRVTDAGFTTQVDNEIRATEVVD